MSIVFSTIYVYNSSPVSYTHLDVYKRQVVKSPMNGNVAAFKDKNQAEKTAQQLGASIIEQ